jgi:heme A synthase
MGNGAQAASKARGFFRALWRAARQVFHETVGAVFFVLALTWMSAALRYWRQHSSTWELRTSVGVVVVVVIFGFMSFRAARRVR